MGRNESFLRVKDIFPKYALKSSMDLFNTKFKTLQSNTPLLFVVIAGIIASLI